jgi:hypothetical protein
MCRRRNRGAEIRERDGHARLMLKVVLRQSLKAQRRGKAFSRGELLEGCTFVVCDLSDVAQVRGGVHLVFRLRPYSDELISHFH